MARTLGKNLKFYFRKIKRLALIQSSIQQDTNCPLPKSTLIKNFNSLYDPTPSSSSGSDTETTTPNFATAFACKRFFFSSPGRSNFIIDSSSSLSSSSLSSSSPDNPPESDTIVGGGIAVPTFSPDPFLDFRQSMQEMVEARDLNDVRESWDYLHELLTCYLALNPKSTHKFIVGAFADLLVSLTPLPVVGGRQKSDISDGGVRFHGGGCN